MSNNAATDDADTMQNGSETAVEPSNEPEGTDTPPESPQSVEELPQWARSQLTKARNEAAKYRVEAKQAAEQARSETSDEYQSKLSELTESNSALQAELDSARVENLKIHAALAVGIPGESAAEFADLLKGSTKREISAHAEKVKALFDTGKDSKPSRAVDPSQGSQDGNTRMSAGQMLANVVRSQ